jgi:hypothetical protein
MISYRIDDGDMSQELEPAATELRFKIARRDEEVNSMVKHLNELLESIR